MKVWEFISKRRIFLVLCLYRLWAPEVVSYKQSTQQTNFMMYRNIKALFRA